MNKIDTCVMLVTDDEVQLPLATADSLPELSKITGLSYTNLQRALHNNKAVRLPKGKYDANKGRVVKVELKDDD